MRAEIKPEYGIVGAGGVSAGLLGQLPRNATALGPVGAVSYRVASRIANTLKAGWAVRSLDEFDGIRSILFHSPREHFATLSDALVIAKIEWTGKCLIFFDCQTQVEETARFESLGASVAWLRRCGLPGRIVLEGGTPAVTMANRLIRELRLKPLVIADGSEALFDAGVTLGSAGLTPLIDGVARILRQCGVRDAESMQLAAGLFARTASEYAHSGRQSWQWHVQEPGTDNLLAQINAVEEPLRSLLARVLLAGFATFDRHEHVARALEELIQAG